MSPDYEPTVTMNIEDAYRVGYHEGTYRAGWERNMRGEYPATVAKEYLADLVKEAASLKPGRIIVFRFRDNAMFVYEVNEVERFQPVTALEIV